MARYLYSEIASAVDAQKRCKANDNAFADKWDDLLDRLEKLLPSGSGFDSGTKIDRDATHAEKIVLSTSFHHMDDNGYYCGWTEHVVTVTPSFRGFNLRVSGRNRNDIKEYIGETFHHTLNEDVEYECLLAMLPESKHVRVEHVWKDECTMVFKVSGETFEGFQGFDKAKAKAVEMMLAKARV